MYMLYVSRLKTFFVCYLPCCRRKHASKENTKKTTHNAAEDTNTVSQRSLANVENSTHQNSTTEMNNLRKDNDYDYVVGYCKTNKPIRSNTDDNEYDYTIQGMAAQKRLKPQAFKDTINSYDTFDNGSDTYNHLNENERAQVSNVNTIGNEYSNRGDMMAEGNYNTDTDYDYLAEGPGPSHKYVPDNLYSRVRDRH